MGDERTNENKCSVVANFILLKRIIEALSGKPHDQAK